MFRHLESMLIASRKSFPHFVSFNFYFFEMKIFLKWKIGVVASFFKTKTDPNQPMKKTCVLKQLSKTSGRSEV